MDEPSNSRKLRGPYKRYLIDTTIPIPRQTLASSAMRMQQKRQRFQNEQLEDNIINDSTPQQENNDEINTLEVLLHNEYDDSSEEESEVNDPSTDNNDAELPGENEYQRSSTIENENITSSEGTVNDHAPLYPGGRITQNVADLLILSYALRHNLNDSAVGDLLSLINAFLPSDILSSKYQFFKKYDSNGVSTTKVLKKYYCKECYVLLDDQHFECDSCSAIYEKSDLDLNYQYFIYLPLKDQLIDFVNSPMYYCLKKRDEFEGDENCIGDITGGKFYRTRLHEASPNDITLQVNTDGVNPSESSSSSLWPLQAVINELPYNLRRKNMFLIALWYNKEKPYMNFYLDLFVQEMNDLSQHGITRTDPTTGEVINIKVRVLLFTVDSVARPMLQNIHQFNGSHGCTFCLQPGEQWKMENSGGHTHIYRGCSTTPKRNLVQHTEDSVLALRTGSVINGVKGPSILNLLDEPFDITKCFSTDCLHNHFLGVTKFFLESWFDSSNHNKEWYLGTKAHEFDSLLLQIRPPAEITRTPQSVNFRKQWKASEFKHFLLYYSITCLRNLLPKKYVDHWSLFVYSTYIYLKPSFSVDEFRMAKIAIRRFVEQIEALYDPSFYRFNVHLLLHVPDIIEMFGALWATSGFPFEHNNGILSQMFYSPKAVPLQIVKRYLRYKNVDWTPLLAEEVPEHARKLFQQLSQKRNFGVYATMATKKRDVQVLGGSSIIEISIILKNCIEREVGISVSIAEEYPRSLVRGIYLHCKDVLPKRCNNVVQLECGNFAIIKKCLLLSHNKIIFEIELLTRIQDIEQITSFIPSSLRNIYTLVRKTGNIAAVEPSKVMKKVVLLPCPPTNANIFMAIPLANYFERD